MPGLCLSLQLIGKDMEEAIEEETSGDLKKAYLTIGKVKPGECSPEWAPWKHSERRETVSWLEPFWKHHSWAGRKVGVTQFLFSREL